MKILGEALRRRGRRGIDIFQLLGMFALLLLVPALRVCVVIGWKERWTSWRVVEGRSRTETSAEELRILLLTRNTVLSSALHSIPFTCHGATHTAVSDQ